MAIIQHFYLFNVPLYNDYENVYDYDFYSFYKENDSNEEIANSLIYNSYNLPDGTRGINLDKKISFPVNLAGHYSDIEKLMRATYCVFRTFDNKSYYYFITSYQMSGPNCIIYELEWDAWQNNLNSISNNIIPQKVSRRTRNDLYISQVSPTLFTVSSSDGYTLLDDKLTFKTDKRLVNKSILWERRILEKDAEIGFKSGDVLTKSSGASTILLPLKVVYRPYCIIDTNFTITFNQVKVNSFMIDCEMSIGRVILNDAELALNEKTVTKSYTFDAPYTYKFKDDYVEISNNVTICNVIDGKEFSNNNLLLSSTAIGPSARNEIYSNIIDLTKYKPINPNKLNINSSFTNDLDGALYKYPFYKVSLELTNDYKIPLIPTLENKSMKLTKFIDAQINSLYKLDYQNITNINSYFQIKGEREGLVNKDSLVSYLRNSGASLATNAFLSSLPSFQSINSSYFTSTIGSDVYNLGANVMNTFSGLIDANNRSDLVSGLSPYLGEIYRNTEPIITIKEATENNELKNIRTNIALFGVPSDEVIDIFEQNRLLYDYIVIPKPILTSINLDNMDLNILNEILTKGLRIWHISKSLDNLLPTGNNVINEISDIFLMKFNRFNFTKSAIPYLRQGE